MAISTDPSVLAAASRCFDTCIPPGAQKAVQTYLWAQIAGITDPSVILTNARCFQSCVPPGGQLALQAYLAAVLAGGSTNPSTLANAATCFSSCIPPGANGAVISYSLANKAGGSIDPSTLVNSARCFSSCIPLGFQLAAQNYLMATIAGVSTDPQVLLSSAGFACFNCNFLPGLAGSVIAYSVAAYAAGPVGPTCQVPTGLAAAWQLDTTTIVTWNAVPAGMDNTEVWSSSDNVTFALAGTVAAPGVTTTLGASVTAPYVKIRFTINSPATNCNFTAAIQASDAWPLTRSWVARVGVNGGAAPSANTVSGLKTFEVSLQGILSQLVYVNVIAPDNLIAAITPWKLPVGANDPSTNNGFVLADLNNTGLRNTSPGNKYLRTGITQLGFAYGHIGIEMQFASNGEANVYDWGCSTAATGTEYWFNNDSQFYGGKTEVALGKNFFPASSYGNVHVAAFNAFMAAERTSTTAMNLYQGDTATGFNLTGTEGGAIGADARVGTVDFQISGQNVSGASVGATADRRYIFVSMSTGLSLANAQTLFNAVQALRAAFGGGVV